MQGILIHVLISVKGSWYVGLRTDAFGGWIDCLPSCVYFDKNL